MIMDISFVIVNWNTAELLYNCLNSIKETVRKYEYEIILVDNGSTDNSISVAEKNFPEVKIIKNEKNIGFSRAVNKGIFLSVGKYVCLLNTDTVLLSCAIDNLIIYLNQNEKTGVAGGQLLYEDGRKQNSFDNFPTLITELFNKSLLRFLFPKKFPGKLKNHDSPLNVESIIGACMLIKRECIEKAGLLDEDYFFFLEETDWCYRISKAGYDIAFVPSARIIHLQGKSAKKANIKSRVEYYYSRYLFFKKNRQRISFLILFVFNFIKCLVKSIIYLFLWSVTLFLVSKWKEKLVLSINLMISHILYFPKNLRLEGNQ